LPLLQSALPQLRQIAAPAEGRHGGQARRPAAALREGVGGGGAGV
jgi:hypothetical protein